MRNASRPFRGLAHWLALLAVLSQALLPVAHAQLMARADGHPLALLACGLGSADFVDALEDVLPPELLAAQAEDGANGTSSAYECPACAALSANGNGLAPSLALDGAAAAAGVRRPGADAGLNRHARQALRPPVRAPPV